MRSGPARIRNLSGRLLVWLLIGLFALPAASGRAEKVPGELLIGIEPEHNIFDQVQRYRLLAAYLSDQLGLKVRLTIMSRYGEVLKRFQSRRLDGAFLGSFTGSMGIEEVGLLPVASPVSLKGESTSRGYIFVRRDSGISDVQEMRQKSVALVDPATMEGYLFVLSHLRRHGVQDPASFFSRITFTGSHASAIFAVLDGRAEIGAAKDTVFDKMVAADPSIGRELRVLARSIKVPEVTLCVRKELPAALREKLAAVLLRMEKTSRGKKVLRGFEALRFIKTDRTEFDKIKKMAREARLPETERTPEK